MPLQGFQKLLQFLELRQLLEWTRGSLTPAQTLSQMLVPTSKLKGHDHREWCPVPLALETLGKSHSGSAEPEMPPSASNTWG